MYHYQNAWQEASEEPDPLGIIARLWMGVHLEMRLEGMVLNIIHSTPTGPSELAAFSVDGVELGKPSGTNCIAFTVWHFQVLGENDEGNRRRYGKRCGEGGVYQSALVTVLRAINCITLPFKATESPCQILMVGVWENEDAFFFQG